MRRAFPLALVALLLGLPACDLFGGDDDTPTEPELRARVVLIGEVNVQSNDQGKAEFLGQVRNVGSATARNVKVSVSVFDGDGDLIDVASTLTVPSTLEPQQEGDFKVVSSTDRDKVSDFRVTIEWED